MTRVESLSFAPRAKPKDSNRRRLVIEGLGGVHLDKEEAKAIGDVVADALNAEGYAGFVELIEEEVP